MWRPFHHRGNREDADYIYTVEKPRDSRGASFLQSVPHQHFERNGEWKFKLIESEVKTDRKVIFVAEFLQGKGDPDLVKEADAIMMFENYEALGFFGGPYQNESFLLHSRRLLSLISSLYVHLRRRS